MAVNKPIYYFGFIAIVALGLTYVFWGADLIPEGYFPPPLTILGYIDDAVVIIGTIFALAKWRQIFLGKKGQPGMGWKGALIYLPVVAALLIYVFWVVDLIPDTVPYIGYADDAAAILAGMFILGKIRRSLKDRG